MGYTLLALHRIIHSRRAVTQHVAWRQTASCKQIAYDMRPSTARDELPGQ